MLRQRPKLSQQRGVAALIVTLLITLIATVATVYASRNSILTQKTADNAYQNAIAAQAAENGMNAFIEQLRIDMLELAKPVADQVADNIKILKAADPTTPAATGCALSGSAIAQYDLINPANYFTGLIAPIVTKDDGVNTLNNVSQKAAYRVNAQIAANGTMYIKAEGCVGNNDTGNDICSSNELAKAIVRKSIKMSTALDPGNNTLVVRNNIDSRSTLNISPIDISKPPQCGALYGSGGKTACTPTMDNRYCLSLAPSSITGITNTTAKDTNLSAMNADDYFKSFFGGMSKSEVKAEAQKNGSVLSGCTGGTIATGKKIIWVEGDIAGVCAINDSDAFVIVNGNITGQLAALNGAFIYANNVFQNGAINVVGSVAVEGVWDVAPLGATLTAGSLGAGRPFIDRINQLDDYLNTADSDQAYDASAGGSLTMSYKKIQYKVPPDAGTSSRTGSWIDF